MEKTYCIYCGEKLGKDGNCPNNHKLKKMCLNCEFLGETEEDPETGKKSLICTNEENKKYAMDRMMKMLEENGGGYSVKVLEIEPVPLKTETKKCGKWRLSRAIEEQLVNDLFV